MTLNILLIQPIVALIAGVLILLRPRLLNYVVAIYLIVVGVTGLWPHFYTEVTDELMHCRRIPCHANPYRRGELESRGRGWRCRPRSLVRPVSKSVQRRHMKSCPVGRRVGAQARVS